MYVCLDFDFLTNQRLLTSGVDSNCLTPDRWQSKTLILSTIVDQKLLDTEFSIAFFSPVWRQMSIENTLSTDL